MAAMTQNIDTRELGVSREPGYVLPFVLADAQVQMFAGSMAAQQVADGLVVEATDTSGLVVLGRTEAYVDNADTDQEVMARPGIFRYVNDPIDPLTRIDIGEPCFVKDAATVCGANGSTNKIAAGLVYDVESIDGCDFVWVCQQVCCMSLAKVRYAELGSES